MEASRNAEQIHELSWNVKAGLMNDEVVGKDLFWFETAAWSSYMGFATLGAKSHLFYKMLLF